MKMPKLSELAQIAEVIAAVAVVVSLVYVGRQMQSNTAAVQAAAVQAVAERSAEGLTSLARDSATSRIRQLGDISPHTG